MRPPYTHSVEVSQITNICTKLKEKCNLRVVWLVFQAGKIDESKTDGDEIIHFLDYENAIEVLEEIKPDIILMDGELTCYSTTFAIAGRFKKIPLVALYLVTDVDKQSITKWLSIKSRLKLALSNRVFASISTESEDKIFGMFRFLLKEYIFLLRTLRKMKFSIFHLLKFITFYPRIQLFAHHYIPFHKIASGDMNLCSIPEWAKKLENAKFPKSSILLIGNPYYDRLFLQMRDYKSDKSLTSTKRIKILLCTSPMHEHGVWTKKEEDSMIISVINEILNRDEFEMAIKIHPSSSSLDEYRKLLKENHLAVTIYQKENLIELLNSYDVMITYGSGTQLLDAILIKKPVVFLDFGHHSLLNLFFDNNLTIECNSIHEILEKIKEAKLSTITNSHHEDYVKKHLGVFDGKSSERAADAILELVKGTIKLE